MAGSADSMILLIRTPKEYCLGGGSSLKVTTTPLTTHVHIPRTNKQENHSISKLSSSPQGHADKEKNHPIQPQSMASSQLDSAAAAFQNHFGSGWTTPSQAAHRAFGEQLHC